MVQSVKIKISPEVVGSLTGFEVYAYDGHSAESFISIRFRAVHELLSAIDNPSIPWVSVAWLILNGYAS